MDQSPTINILPEYIANQIAAGEVVQKPESVVKELVENSLDSGCDTVAVIVRDAGKQLMHVVDNGRGMSSSDLQLSVRRHATSKIITAEDLENINTFGFRGEALASIAAVAMLEIRSRRSVDSMGWKLTVEPSKAESIEPVNTDIGTQVFVKNLFFNVPARRKFLKSNLTEFRYISDTMIKFALAKPQIRFTFYDGDTLVFDLSASTLESRITTLFGSSVASPLIKVTYDSQITQIDGYLAQPQQSRGSRQNQYFFLNGRSIQSRSLSHAVFSALEHILEKNQQPFFALNLTVDPRRVDVNVHPQKHEVKFDDERVIYNAIHKAVTSALRSNNLLPDIALAEQEAQSPIGVAHSPGTNDKFVIVNKSTGEILESHATRLQQGDVSGFIPSQARFGSDRHWQPQRPGFQPRQYLTGSTDIFSPNKPSQPAAASESEPSTALTKYFQIHNKYIIYQSPDGIVLIDQHAAHERILYEKAIKAMNRELSYSQELLFPVLVRLNPAQMAVIKEIEQELSNLGFNIKITAPDTAELTGIPSDVSSGKEELALLEIVDTYTEYQKTRTPDKRDNLAASYACKNAIKTAEPLTELDIKYLVERLNACQMPFVCPHGRPTMIELKLTELDKHFKRT